MRAAAAGDCCQQAQSRRNPAGQVNRAGKHLQLAAGCIPPLALCSSCFQALLDCGYTLLDVRTELESNARGKIRGSVCIPCANARQQFDAASGQMVRVAARACSGRSGPWEAGMRVACCALWGLGSTVSAGPACSQHSWHPCRQVSTVTPCDTPLPTRRLTRIPPAGDFRER